MLSVQSRSINNPRAISMPNWSRMGTVSAILTRLRRRHRAIEAAAKPDLRAPETVVRLLSAGDVLSLAKAGFFPPRGDVLAWLEREPNRRRQTHFHHEVATV